MRKEDFTHYCMLKDFNESEETCWLWSELTGELYSQIQWCRLGFHERGALARSGLKLIPIQPISLENE